MVHTAIALYYKSNEEKIIALCDSYSVKILTSTLELFSESLDELFELVLNDSFINPISNTHQS